MNLIDLTIKKNPFILIVNISFLQRQWIPPPPPSLPPRFPCYNYWLKYKIIIVTSMAFEICFPNGFLTEG